MPSPIETTPSATRRPSFDDFYHQQFLPEHAHPANRALHYFGTLAGLVFVPLSLMSAWPWAVILFPAVHALPGLLGHRLFERNAAVGDLRVLRTDAPGLWFLLGNHRMLFALLARGVGSGRGGGER